MKILVTGGGGFVGRHLVRELETQGDEVWVGTIECEKEDRHVQFFLDDENWMDRVLEKGKFDVIYHLAGQPSVHISFEKPFEVFVVNTIGALNLIKLVAERYKQTKLVVAGTSEVYKLKNEALTEDCDFDPKSPYAMSKLVVDYFIRKMSNKLELNCTLMRPFSNIGPGQHENFALSSFAKQIAEIKLGKREKKIRVGNLNVYRDFIDVRDAVKAYSLVKNENEKGEVYDICSGILYKLSDCLDKLIQISGVEGIKIEVDQNRLRTNDVEYCLGSYEKINKKFGWKPEIKIEKTLTDLFNYWYEKLSS